MLTEKTRIFFDTTMANLPKSHGRCKQLILPSGPGVVIREQNGEDDDTLSNVTDASNGTSFNNFVRDIIVAHENYPAGVTFENILDMLIRDKYYIILASRIHSLGVILRFPWKWDDVKANTMYEEDLAKYFWDFYAAGGAFPGPDSEEYSEDLLKPYNSALTSNLVEATLASGKEIGFYLADGRSESYLISLPEDQSNKNSELRARRLSLKDAGGVYHLVQSFKTFSPRDMQEIRTLTQEYDAEFAAITQIPHPNKKDVKVKVNVLTLVDFFFPAGI